MDITKDIQARDGKTQKVKVQMPSVELILQAVKQRGLFAQIQRYQYMQYDMAQAMAIVEAIGKSRNPLFTIDNENRFTYENFIKWCHCDTSMQCLDPDTRTVIPARLKRGIYIAGNTGTGKSWCLEIMLAYAMAMRFKIQFIGDDEPRNLWWRIERADAICDAYMDNGSLQTFKNLPLLGIQDMGSEPQETMYMGNRIDVLRQIIEYRGDKADQITLITSNMKINGERLKERYGDRVESRLREMCNYFEITGRDRRK